VDECDRREAVRAVLFPSCGAQPLKGEEKQPTPLLFSHLFPSISDDPNLLVNSKMVDHLNAMVEALVKEEETEDEDVNVERGTGREKCAE
jgi:hypothetical protein